MNTAPKPSFALSAQFLGPVFSLNAEITKYAQNIIFARNGIGKSFLSRAFRYLDKHGQEIELTDAARNLVSDEAPDGKGTFSFSRGTNVLGSLQLEVATNNATAQLSDTIFHVFSDDFVQEELRERKYTINGEIENQISVDSDSIKLTDAKNALENAQAEKKQTSEELRATFGQEKLEELNVKAGVYKQLKEYKELDFETQILNSTKKPNLPDPRFSDILRDLDSLKAIPSDPAYPEDITPIMTENIDFVALRATLERITSPSSVSDEIRQRIESHHEFYQAGTNIVQNEDRATCPFCDQDIVAADPKSIIDSYIEYFSDEEEKHKSELRTCYGTLKSKERDVKHLERQISRQKTRYDELKRFVPSRKDTEINDSEKALQRVCEVISSYKSVIDQKHKNLSARFSLPSDDLLEVIGTINRTVESNNTNSSDLRSAVSRADHERRSLQRTACSVFGQEFAIRNWGKIENIKKLADDARTKARDLAALESLSPSAEARVRVAKTFERLLRVFFDGKYVFDKELFTLKRGDQEMIRGPHRTLSDGEKTAIAFCYFVACAHLKVKADSDYEKLFLVFDDPVTSMSYDFVFSIAQTLKNLSISNQGEVSVNPSDMDRNKRSRPDLLILTHSSYFFNISLTNRVVPESAAFALHEEGNQHQLTKLNQYVAPFHQQLKDIYQVANGKDPDHGTGNAIRSVLEAVGRFCRPDKCSSLTEFICFLASEEKDISLKSVLINSLSHGSYYEETPSPSDLALACKETIGVVQKYACGQLEIIRKAAASAS